MSSTYGLLGSGCPGSLDIKSHERTRGVDGRSSAHAVFTCSPEDVVSAETYLLWMPNPFDPSLVCTKVRSTFPQGDFVAGETVLELACDFEPNYYAVFQALNDPFRVRKELCSASKNLEGCTWYFSDGTPLAAHDVHVLLPVTQTKLVLFGVRGANWNISNCAPYEDKTNSDVFYGAKEETLFFEGGSDSPRKDANNNWVTDVQIHMTYRPSGWNTAYNPAVKDFQTITDSATSGGNKPRPSTAFNPILILK